MTMRLQTFQPGSNQLEEVEQMKPLPFEDTPFVFVDTEEKLVAMVKDLKCVKMFAADLEVTTCTSLHCVSLLSDVHVKHITEIIITVIVLFYIQSAHSYLSVYYLLSLSASYLSSSLSLFLSLVLSPASLLQNVPRSSLPAPGLHARQGLHCGHSQVEETHECTK